MTRPPATPARSPLPPVTLSEAEQRLLVRLLELPTAGPLEVEGDHPVELWQAQREYASAAAELGFEVVHHAPADETEVSGEHVPATVRDALAQIPDFLAKQPNLVLRLGPPRPRAATVMFNVHLDTVAGTDPVVFDGIRFHGRGAIDAKGPAVALLAGVRAAREAVPALGEEIAVLIQAVSGEEGGAMGVFGTRPLIQRGHVGRLNVFCEPTGRRVLTRSTAAMTARLRVAGHDAIDDDPGAGHNATVLLGFLAQHLATELPPHARDGQVCIAGLHTGTMHNKVYGTGELLLNLSYGSVAGAQRLAEALDRAVRTGLDEFASRFADTELFRLTAMQAADIVELDWLKRGLPALTGADPWAEDLIRDAGLSRWPEKQSAFTCDAIWMNGVPDATTVVFGPGDLGANNAHADGEYADLAELNAFAHDVARILESFSHHQLRDGT
ncbi:MAG TPA: M20/M25/M40 family metallo-hydrolase [Micromonospora sp.]|nr:M20/M25/M40 family metallo-hydrolase [Micromonospora sp.]